MAKISVDIVEGEVNYEEAMKEFGISPFTFDLKNDKNISKYMPPIYKRDLVIGHRDFQPIYEAIKKKKKFAVLTGVNPSGHLHLGNKLFLDQALFFQKLGGEVFIPVSNDETYVFRKTDDLDKATKNAEENIIPEIIALGFDPKHTHFFISTQDTRVYELAVKLSTKTTFSTIKAIFGFNESTNPGQIFYAVVQSAHILLPQLILGKIPTVVPIGIDQDPYIRLSRDIAQKAGFIKPSSTYHMFLPGLQRGKMSGSKPETCIFLDDSEQEARKKIMRSFSGGASSLEEHRKKGGNSDIDSAFQYLYYIFEEDDSKLQSIRDKYMSGQMTSGEMKEYLFKKVSSFLKQQAKQKKKVKNIDKFMLK